MARALRPASTPSEVVSSSKLATLRAPLPPPEPSAPVIALRCSLQYGMYAPYATRPAMRRCYGPRHTAPQVSRVIHGSGVIGIFAAGVIGEVAHPFHRRDLLGEHRLDALEHRHLAHRAAVAAAAHRHVHRALAVVAG